MEISASHGVSAADYGVDEWQEIALYLFYLCLDIRPSFGGVSYGFDYGVLSDFANKTETEAVEWLGYLKKMADGLQKGQKEK